MNSLLQCRTLVLLTGLFVIGNSPWAQDSRIFTQQELVYDARQLAWNLEQSHPDPYIGGGGKVTFQRRFQGLIEEIPAGGMTAEQFYRLLLPFVASLRDGHTAVLPPHSSTESQAGLPLTFKIIDESLAVDSAMLKNNTDLRGALLLKVEGIPLSELVRRQNNLRGIENVFGTLALLTRSLATERGLQTLLPELRETENIRLTLRLADGESKDFLFERGEIAEGTLDEPGSRVLMPDMSGSSIAWNFLDKDRQTALLKIDDMSSYREAFESWMDSGMTESLEMARATYQDLHGRAAPEEIDEILAGIPSATDVFKDLALAMKQARTSNLVVDLRENTGGNDLMVPILLYFLFGQETMISYDEGFQISRYSELYFQVYANESLEEVNRGRALPLEVGDYDFSGQQARNKRIDPQALHSAANELAGTTRTFREIFNQGTYENLYRPPHIVVLSSAWTYSSGFTMLAALEGLGATVVGTPSAHAGNNFGDSLLFRLPNTALRGAVSFKQNVTFPDDPDKGRCLTPDVLLTHEKWSSLDFDPNAEVLLALEYLRNNREANNLAGGSN
jgi:hypothetical protein